MKIKNILATISLTFVTTITMIPVLACSSNDTKLDENNTQDIKPSTLTPTIITQQPLTPSAITQSTLVPTTILKSTLTPAIIEQSKLMPATILQSLLTNQIINTQVPKSQIQPKTNTDSPKDFLQIGPKIKSLDFSDTLAETNIVIDKDGNKITWPAFKPIRATRAQSRNPFGAASVLGTMDINVIFNKLKELSDTGVVHPLIEPSLTYDFKNTELEVEDLTQDKIQEGIRAVIGKVFILSKQILENFSFEIKNLKTIKETTSPIIVEFTAKLKNIPSNTFDGKFEFKSLKNINSLSFIETKTPAIQTKLTEEFTRTSSPGAMDVIGFHKDGVDGFISEDPNPKSVINQKINELKSNPPNPVHGFKPILFNDFKNIKKIFDTNFLFLKDYNTNISLAIDENIINNLFNAIGINLDSLGIKSFSDVATREAHSGTIEKHNVKIITLRNVILQLCNTKETLQFDINVIVK